jgi:hypothetical protein
MSEERRGYSTGRLEPIHCTYKNIIGPLAHSTSKVGRHSILLGIKQKV